MRDARTFPVALKLAGRRCLVLGEGAEAAFRAQALLEAGALVVVVAAAPSAELEALAAPGGSERLRLEYREFESADLDGVWLVVQTRRDAALSRLVDGECERRATLFCAVDQPAQGSFSHLAQVRSGSLTLAIGTEGRAPALARRLREVLQDVLDGSGMAAFVERLAELRERTPSAERAKVLGEAVRELRFEGRLVLPSEAQR